MSILTHQKLGLKPEAKHIYNTFQQKNDIQKKKFQDTWHHCPRYELHICTACKGLTRAQINLLLNPIAIAILFSSTYFFSSSLLAAAFNSQIPMANISFSMLCLLMLAPLLATATQFKVGGSMGWTVPPPDSHAMLYNQWASNLRFQIGDSLLFVYPAGKDSLLQVTADGYANCKTSSPLAKFDDGNTVFMFDRSGPYYFISGIDKHCMKNQSMIVVVLADRTNASKHKPSSPPPPSHTDDYDYPSPPNPHSAAAPVKVVGAMSSIGALLGSALLAFF